MTRYILTTLAALELSEAANLFSLPLIFELIVYEFKISMLFTVVFLLSSNMTTLIRSLLLLLAAYKITSLASALLFITTGSMLINTSLIVFSWLTVSMWVVFKPQKYPGVYVDDPKKLSREKVYVAVSHSTSSPFDVFMSIAGWSATSVSYVIDDMWYIFRKSTGKFSVYPFNKIPCKGRIFIEIDIDQMVAVESLSLHIGTKWSIIKNNCVTTPREFWKKAGVDLKFYDIAPGLLVKKLWKQKQL